MGRDGVISAQFVSMLCGPQVYCEGALRAGKWETATHLCHMVHMLPVNREEDEFLALESRMHRLACTPGSRRLSQTSTSSLLDYLG